MSKIEFRPCSPEDVNQAVPLIIESGPESFSYVFNNKKTSAHDFLKYVFQKIGGEFSFNNHFVLLMDGEIVGIGAAFNQKKANGFMLKDIISILQFYKLKAFEVMIRGLKVEQKLKMPIKNEVYLAHITIHKKFRSKGFGQQLIQSLMEHHKANTSTKFVLDVSEENPRAKILYQRLGFTESNYVPSNLKNRYGYIPNFFRMEL